MCQGAVVADVSTASPSGLHLGSRRLRLDGPMSSLLDSLLGLPTPLAYALVGGLAFGESVLLLGFVLPGEAAVLLGGVLASQGRASLPAMIAVAAGGAVLGDSVGFEIGRRAGPGLLARPRLARYQPRVERVEALMRRRGAWAVIVGRFTAYLRPMVPAVAGPAGMAYRTFLAANLAGGLAWAAAVTSAGYGLGDAYEQAIGISRWAGLAVLAVLAIAATAVWWRRRRRRHTTTPSTNSQAPTTSERSAFAAVDRPHTSSDAAEPVGGRLGGDGGMLVGAVGPSGVFAVSRRSEVNVGDSAGGRR
jgi:membrane-associated protein